MKTTDGFVSLHVEALNPVSPVHLCEEERVEGDDDGRGHEDASRVQRSSSRDPASIEGELDPCHLPPPFVVSTSGCVVESFDIDMSFEWVLGGSHYFILLLIKWTYAINEKELLHFR